MTGTAIATATPLTAYLQARRDGGFGWFWRPPGGPVSVGLGAASRSVHSGAGRFTAAAAAASQASTRTVSCFAFGDGDPNPDGPWAGIPSGLVVAPQRWMSWPAHAPVGVPPLAGAAGGPVLTSLPQAAQFAERVAAAAGAIRAGQAAKLVLTRAVRVDGLSPGAAVRALARLLEVAPSCTVFAVGEDGWDLVGATPELLVRTDGTVADSEPLAGTVPALEDASAQTRQVDALLADGKQGEEHALVVAAVETAMRSRCDHVAADAHPRVVRHEGVAHLATRVRGIPRRGCRPLDLVAALHPTPAVGAVPHTAVALARSHDVVDRGLYCGPIGWSDGLAGDFRIALRCALVRDSTAHLFAGAGIVAASDPETEARETQWKLRPMLDALLSTQV